MAAYPLGAHCVEGGVNFALAAPHAEAVELCLFDAAGSHETARLTMRGVDAGVWHEFVPDLFAGQVYGYRVHGQGDHYNPDLVVLDPYAREIVGDYRGQSGSMRARVTDEHFDWGDDKAPRTPAAATVLYETHVKSFTRQLTGVPAELRGTYAGMSEPAALDHLAALGVTAVSLLPLHQRADEPRLLQLGLSNHWGYSTIGFFAAEPRYWSGRAGTTPALELRQMVKSLHQRSIEVILDVVYNHTAELDQAGPTLSMRAIDNALYYHLQPDGSYENWTGCGNTLNLSEPRVLQLVMDSLRYWVVEFHVDGFRFDLAPVLGRGSDGFSKRAAFFAALAQDPVLARVKLIAEPWDIGPGGYQLGQFPAGWMEWNDRYRDTVRGFWLGDEVTLGQLAERLAGSSDIFDNAEQGGARTPSASVNFICAHDGFTLRDLVSYNERHNEANGEGNRDGHGHNLSWNCGVEGATGDAAILDLRATLQRALLATLMLSNGTPMLLAGDELGHTQGGNNNAYCQDNAGSWIDWAGADTALAAYVARLIALRMAHPALRRNDWATPIEWFGTDGAAPQWSDPAQRAIGMRMEDCLILINASADTARFALPAGDWLVQLDSAMPAAPAYRLEACATISARTVLLAVSQYTKHTVNVEAEP